MINLISTLASNAIQYNNDLARESIYYYYYQGNVANNCTTLTIIISKLTERLMYNLILIVTKLK